MKNFLLFFFLFIVLNIADTEQKKFTKEKIDEIVKNIKEISKSNYCDKVTLIKKLEIFDLDEYKKTELYSQLINGCKLEDKEIFIRVFYKFFKKEIEEDAIQNNTDQIILKLQRSFAITEEDDADNGLATYLCEKFMDLIGYDPSEC